MSISIGCVSDTHVPTRASRIPDKLYEILNQESVKFIFLAGDLVNLNVIDDLESNTKAEEVIAVHGNMDRYEVKSKLPKLTEFEVLGHAILMAHKVKHIPLKEKEVSLAIYGHTHRNKISKKGRTVLINPGSGTGAGIFTARSIGIVTITKEDILPRIIKF